MVLCAAPAPPAAVAVSTAGAATRRARRGGSRVTTCAQSRDECPEVFSDYTVSSRRQALAAAALSLAASAAGPALAVPPNPREQARLRAAAAGKAPVAAAAAKAPSATETAAPKTVAKGAGELYTDALGERRGGLSSPDAVPVPPTPLATPGLRSPPFLSGFSVSVPSSWGRGEGAASGSTGAPGAERRVVSFLPYPDSAGRASLSVTATNTAADFTGLGSFGTAESFGQTLVNGLDRSWQKAAAFDGKSGRGGLTARDRAGAAGAAGAGRDAPGAARPTGPPGNVQVARLVAAREMRVPCAGAAGEAGITAQVYEVEWTVWRPDTPAPQHLWERVALAFDGTYNRLYTATAQCSDTEAEGEAGEAVRAALATFAPPVGV